MEEWETIYIWLPKALGLGFLHATQEPKYPKHLFQNILKMKEYNRMSSRKEYPSTALKFLNALPQDIPLYIKIFN